MGGAALVLSPRDTPRLVMSAAAQYAPTVGTARQLPTRDDGGAIKPNDPYASYSAMNR